MKKVSSLVLLIIWMIVIFILSNQSGVLSKSESGIIVSFINKITNIDINTLQFIIRKIAHVLEYTILYILIYNYIKFFNTNNTTKLSILFTLLYACIDETHQLFIDGRTGKFLDVLVDSIGIFIGYLIEVKYEKKNKTLGSNIN